MGLKSYNKSMRVIGLESYDKSMCVKGLEFYIKKFTCYKDRII